MAPHCCQASNSRTEWALSIFLQQEEITYTTKRCRSWLIFSAKNHGNRYWSGFSGCWIGGLEGSICQGSSVTQSRLTHCNPMDCSTPGFPVHHQLPEFTQNSCPPVSDAFQPSPPLLSPSPPAFNLSQHQGLFQWVSSSYQVAKVLEFQLQHQSLQWYSGLISFRMDWFHLLAVQETLKSLLQCHSSKASILHHSAFFMVQLSHPYMTTGETIALTRRTYVNKVMSLLFNMLSSLA